MTKLERLQGTIEALLEAIRLSWIDMATKPLSNADRMADRAIISRYEDELLRLLAARDSLIELGQGDDDDV